MQSAANLSTYDPLGAEEQWVKPEQLVLTNSRDESPNVCTELTNTGSVAPSAAAHTWLCVFFKQSLFPPRNQIQHAGCFHKEMGVEMWFKNSCAFIGMPYIRTWANTTAFQFPRVWLNWFEREDGARFPKGPIIYRIFSRVIVPTSRPQFL